MDINKMKGLLHDDAAKTKVTLKEGDQSITVERTPSENAMTANGLLGGMVGGISPTPVSDDKMINVTSGEFVVNKPAAEKYAGLLEDINNEGREMLARGGWSGKSPMEGYAKGGKLSEKISKIYDEGYTAPGQAYAIAKNMGYQQGGEVTWTGNPAEDAKMIANHKLFKRLVDESKQYGYAPEELPSLILSNQYLNRLFDTPEKQEALLLANAASQSAPNYAEGGTIKKENRGKFTEYAKSKGMSVAEAANKIMANKEHYSPELVKRANFAKNAQSWAEGGKVNYQDGGWVNTILDNIAKIGINPAGAAQAVPGAVDTYNTISPYIGIKDVSPRPQGGHAARNWDRKYGKQYNPDGTPKNFVGNDPSGGDIVANEALKAEQDRIANPIPIGHEEDVVGIASDKALTPVSGSETATKDTSGVLDNRSFDFILEKSRGLAAGKGFGGAKLGAREYVDELYKPVETTTTKAGSGSKRVFNLEWRNPETGQVEVRAGRRNAEGEFELQDENGVWKPAFEITGTSDIRVAPRSADPGVEAGAGGIPNASSYNEITKVPTFEFARESEAKAYGYVVRAIGADQQLTKLENEIDPQKIAGLYGGLAQWAARNANAKITAAVINNYLQEAGLQRYSREMTKFLQAVLRTDTGAAYTGTEIADYLSAFGISPGTQITPEILQGFQLGRKQEIGAQIGRTGKAGAYLNGLLAGKYPIPYSSVIGSSISGDGKSGQTSSGVNWKIK